jgi:hypothetical protein
LFLLFFLSFSFFVASCLLSPKIVPFFPSFIFSVHFPIMRVLFFYICSCRLSCSPIEWWFRNVTWIATTRRTWSITCLANAHILRLQSAADRCWPFWSTQTTFRHNTSTRFGPLLWYVPLSLFLLSSFLIFFFFPFCEFSVTLRLFLLFFSLFLLRYFLSVISLCLLLLRC